MTGEGGMGGEYVANDGEHGLWSRESSNQIVEKHGELLTRAEGVVREMWSIAFPESDELSRKAAINRLLPLWKTTSLALNTNGHANHGANSNGEIIREASPRIQFNPSDESSLVRTWFHETLHIQETDESKRTNQYVEATTTLLTMLTEDKYRNVPRKPGIGLETIRKVGMHWREALPIYLRYQELVASGVDENECYKLLAGWQHNNDQSFINMWNERVGNQKGVTFDDLTWFSKDNLAESLAGQIKKVIGRARVRK